MGRRHVKDNVQEVRRTGPNGQLRQAWPPRLWWATWGGGGDVPERQMAGSMWEPALHGGHVSAGTARNHDAEQS
jgi:hypothetical protein